MNLINNADEKTIAKGLQSVQLELLEELDRVCNLLEIQYSLAYGTAIGAVRHNGFIPWDDDIDVYMKVDDLEKLQNNGHLFKEPFFLQHQKTDPEYGLIITRLRNSNTTLIEGTEVDRDINHGIFIDIYPLFNVPKNKAKSRMINLLAMTYRLMLYGVAPKNHGRLINGVAKIILDVVPVESHRSLMNCCYGAIRNQKKTGFVSTYIWGEQLVVVPEEWIFPTKRIQFESMKALIGCGYDSFLRQMYGDYTQLPPEDQRKFHHDYVCIDVDNSYKQYEGQFYCKGKK